MIILGKWLQLNIADIVLHVESTHQGIDFVIGEQYEKFLSSAQPDVTLQWHCDLFPELGQVEEIFDSGSFWRLQSANGYFILNYPAPGSGKNLFKIVRLTQDFRKGDIYLHPNFLPERRRTNPLTARLDELLYMHLLGQGRGVLFHACCVDHNGRGLLFLGHSEAGKSTLARLWKKHCTKARILSDECVIVRYVNGRYYAYGTPWHGTAECALPARIPLTEVYIVEHARTNFLQPLEGVQQVAEVMTRSFIPYWLRSATELSVSFLSRMLQTIPCQRLGFRPTKGIFDLLHAKDE